MIESAAYEIIKKEGFADGLNPDSQHFRNGEHGAPDCAFPNRNAPSLQPDLSETTKVNKLTLTARLLS